MNRREKVTCDQHLTKKIKDLRIDKKYSLLKNWPLAKDWPLMKIQTLMKKETSVKKKIIFDNAEKNNLWLKN